MKLPLQYEANMSSFLEKIEATPPANFDDLIPFEIKTTEFDSQPKTVRIVGTSAPFTGPPIDIN